MAVPHRLVGRNFGCCVAPSTTRLVGCHRMALHGINVAYNPVGYVRLLVVSYGSFFHGVCWSQETSLLSAFEALNISNTQMMQWFTGPSYLPWLHNGQLDGILGPLAANWFSQRAQLASNIAAALTSLGIQQASPMFVGHVPPSFAAQHPEANAIRLPAFSPFNDTYSSVWWLPPSSPLFETIFHQVESLQSKVLGSTSFLYGTPFGGAGENALPLCRLCVLTRTS